MKIRIADLSHEGLKISAPISLESLNARLHEGQGCDITFTEAPLVNIVVTRTADGAETRGKVSTKYTQACGRCADDVERTLEVDLNFILKAKPPHIPKNSPEYEDDFGILFFEGEHVDFESTVQESLILNLSQYWSPPVDNCGECTVCGKGKPAQLAETNERTEARTGTVSLGDLLKKAGIQ